MDHNPRFCVRGATCGRPSAVQLFRRAARAADAGTKVERDGESVAPLRKRALRRDKAKERRPPACTVVERSGRRVDRANKAAVAQQETRVHVAFNLLERLSCLPEGTPGYDQAFDCIGALESIAAGTDVSRKVEKLLAARAAVSACGAHA